MDEAKYSIEDGCSLLEAAEAIIASKARAVVVLRNASVVGVISEGDILRALMRGADLRGPLSPHMVLSMKFLRAADWVSALSIFQRHAVSMLPVVDEGMHLLQVITMKDVLSRCRLIEPNEGAVGDGPSANGGR